MSISPFMAGVHGFLVRRQQVKDAQTLQEHELNLVKTKAMEAHKASQMFTPTLWVPDGQGGRKELTDSSGNVAYFDTTDVQGLPDLTNLADIYMDVREKNYNDMDENQRAHFDAQGGSLMSLINDELGHSNEKDFWMTNFAHPIAGLFSGGGGPDNAFKQRPNHMPVSDGNTTWSIPEIKPEYPEISSDVEKYRGFITPRKKYPEDAALYSDEELYVGHQIYSKLGTQFYAQIKSGRIAPEVADYLVNMSYLFHGGDTRLDQKNRDSFVYNVMESVTKDFLSVNDGQRTIHQHDEIAYMKGRIDVEAKSAKASSSREAINTGVGIIALMENYQEDNPEQVLPGGTFGRLQGFVANFFSNTGGKRQIQELGLAIVEGLGLNFEKGGLEKFEARVRENLSQERIKEIGTYRAAFEVYQEVLAYQMASALQGGTGGRTISDQDVVNIKRALGESLFVDGQFQIHRMETLIGVLQTINSVNERYGNIQSIGQYHTAKAYEKYVYGVKIARSVNDGGLGTDLRGGTSYPVGQLSRKAVTLTNNIFAMADLEHGIEGVHNEAQAMLDNPETWEQGKTIEGKSTEQQYKETDFEYTYKDILDNKVTANIGDEPFDGTINQLLEKRKTYLDEEGNVRSDGIAEVTLIDALLNTHLKAFTSKNESPKE